VLAREGENIHLYFLPDRAEGKQKKLHRLLQKQETRISGTSGAPGLVVI
jgi:hypothetical protein